MSVTSVGRLSPTTYTFVSQPLLQEDQKQFDDWFEHKYKGRSNKETLQSRYIDAYQELDISDLDLTSLPNLEKFSTLISIKLSTQTVTSSDVIEPFTLLDMANLHLWKDERVENNHEKRHIAFDRIIAEAQKQSSGLMFNSLSLSLIPKEIGKLENLKYLSLGNNRLTSLPPEIGKLKKLHTLGLRKNRLTFLPEEIGNLKNLKELDLSINKLTFFPLELENLEHLHELLLHENQLTFLPPEIGKLKNLQKLALSWNQLTFLPPEIGNLEHLKYLHLYKNQLTSLPVEIGNLKNLQRLLLDQNQLNALPQEIGELKNLQKLNLSVNYLISLSPEIIKLKNLEFLHLYNNQLTFLPIEIEKLENLKDLSLGNNRLTSLPPEIGKLKKLHTLDLRENRLTFLPEEIGNLKNLKELDLSINQLTFFPLEIGNLEHLHELLLHENQLTFLPPEIGKLKKLHILGLHENQLTFLPPEIGNLEHLKYLYLYKNQLTSLPPSFFDLPRNCAVDLEGNNFSEEALLSIRRRVGNRFTVNMSIHEGPSSFTNLNDALNELKKAAGVNQIYQNQNRRLLEAFFQHLSFCKEYKNIHTRKYIADFLIRCFKLGAENEHFKQIFLSSLDSASGTCGDRVSVTLNYLHLHYCLITGEFPEGFTSPDFFVGQKRLDLLDEAAREFVQTYLGVIDEIEVYLALQVKLQKELKLPLLAQDMLFFSCSGLTPDILEHVKERVLHMTKDRKQVLLSSENWKEYICKTYKEEYEKVIKPYAEVPEHGMIKISGSERPETDQEYHQRLKVHTEKRERAIYVFIEEKTEELCLC